MFSKIEAKDPLNGETLFYAAVVSVVFVLIVVVLAVCSYLQFKFKKLEQDYKKVLERNMQLDQENKDLKKNISFSLSPALPSTTVGTSLMNSSVDLSYLPVLSKTRSANPNKW